MANAYLTDEAKERLDELCELETRGVSAEIEFLVERRLEELDNE